jgi:copper chaperone CopZ
MFIHARRYPFLAAILWLSLSGNLLGAQPRYTAIYIDDMHCATCAKKIAGQLYSVAGVVEVRADVPKSIAYVVPQQEKDPSPRALWEAVEQAGFKPVKLQGPQGIYTAKPKT